MNFDKLILKLNSGPKSNIFYKTNLLLSTRNWPKLGEIIRRQCLYGETVWSDGHALLDKALEHRDSRLVEFLVRLLSSLSLVDTENKEFLLFPFIFYLAIVNKDRVLIDYLVAVGVNFNDPLDRETPLVAAIRTQAGLEIIKLIINHGACVNGRGKFLFFTPLAQVIGFPPSDLDVAELLFSYGADVNLVYPESTSKTLVHLACEVSNNKGLQWLLNKKADPNIPTELGETGLHIAVRLDDLSNVTTLLEYGASLNMLNGMKKTPLIIAVETYNSKIADLLLQHRAEFCINTLTKALERNITGNRSAVYPMFEVLTNYGFVPRINIFDKALIHDAARNGQSWVVETFLNAGGSPNSVYNNTPLLYEAITSNNKSLVGILLDYGSDTSYDDPNVSALTFSVSSNLVEITELLLSRGHNDLSRTCIFIAANNLNLDMLKVLVKFGVNVNIECRGYWSPLHIAILSEKYVSRFVNDIDLEKAEVVRFLVVHGPSLVSWQNLDPNDHPIHIAISRSYVQVAKVLLEAGTSFDYFVKGSSLLLPSTILHYALQYKSKEMVRMLIENGAVVDSLQYDGKTPLFIAVELGDLNIVRVLLEKGANITGNACASPDFLFYAVEINSTAEVVEELLKFGADADTYFDGTRALHKACLLGNGGVVAVLLDHGASINAVDYVSNTPFMVLKKTSLAMRIVAQGNWFGYEHGEAIASPSTPLYHLQRHAFKLDFLGLPLHSCFKPVLGLDYSKDFISSCKKELEDMKTCKIGTSYLRLYDIVKQEPDPRYVFNESVLLSLSSVDQWGNAPLYHGILKCCIKEAGKRRSLLSYGSRWLSKLVCLSCPNVYLPDEVVCEIMSYLKNKELFVLTLGMRFFRSHKLNL